MHPTLVNGKPGDTIGVTDRGLQFGDGVFETIAVIDGRPRHWQLHMARLQRSLAKLKFHDRPDPDLLYHEAIGLCADQPRAVLKLIITRGDSQRGYAVPADAQCHRILRLTPWPEWVTPPVGGGVKATLCQTRLARQPALAGIKHLNRLEHVLARLEWDSEYAEGLMCDDHDLLIEGTMSNVFLIREGALHTPLLNHCGVEGVMREHVLETAQSQGIEVEIQPLHRLTLREFDEVFLTNSVIGIWPVQSVDEMQFPLGPITQQLQQAINR
jgi:4-amino-4-deoxychorismate lyase